MYEKSYLFAKGARPVIYQPNSDFDLLHEDHKYRHVKFELDEGIDWTWEREWRIKIDELALEPDKVTLIVPNRSWEKRFQEDHHVSVIHG